MNKLKYIGQPLPLESESLFIKGVLDALNDTRILIASSDGSPLDESNEYHIMNFDGPLTVEQLEAFDVLFQQNRFRVLREGMNDDENGNVRMIAGTTYRSFGNFGEFVEFIRGGSYPLPLSAGTPLVPAVPASAVHSDVELTLSGGVVSSMLNGSTIEIKDGESVEGSYTILDGDSIADINLSIGNAGTAFADGNLFKIRTVQGYTVEVSGGAIGSVNEAAVPEVPAVAGVKASGILLDQITGSLSLVDVNDFTGDDPLEDEEALVATIEADTSSVTRSLFE